MDATTKPALLHCPFCKSDMSSFVPTEDGCCVGAEEFYVECECGAMGPAGKTVVDAIAAWNRRIAAEAPAPSEPFLSQLASTEQTLRTKGLADDAERVRHAMRLLDAAPLSQPSIPPGYAIVPVEPTPEMIEAMQAYVETRRPTSDPTFAGAYHVMVAAAPALPAAQLPPQEK
jgi:hypothetical protein